VVVEAHHGQRLTKLTVVQVVEVLQRALRIQPEGLQQTRRKVLQAVHHCPVVEVHTDIQPEVVEEQVALVHLLPV
jgi:hypothetical protein